MSIRNLLFEPTTLFFVVLDAVFIFASIVGWGTDWMTALILGVSFAIIWVVAVVHGYDRTTEFIDQETIQALNATHEDAVIELSKAMCEVARQNGARPIKGAQHGGTIACAFHIRYARLTLAQIAKQ